MKKICFVTGTRADYGIMAPVMREINLSGEAELQIVATNMHLSERYGMTVNEIEEDGFKVNVKITSLAEEIMSGDDSWKEARYTVESMGRVLSGLAAAFEDLKPDIVVILGDRYETLVAAEAAVVFNIPVVHLHGGETTEGAIDDYFRHAITKLSTFHFASTPQYAQNIISMGEKPSYVFHSGAPGAEGNNRPENEAEEEELNREFREKTGIDVHEPFLILAFHPVTLLADKGAKELEAILKALAAFMTQGYKVLVTMPNSDPGSMGIISQLKEWSNLYTGTVSAVKSLGARLFHHALEHAAAIVGNSSAALIEAPSHRLGAVNVGERQKGRAHGMTVIDVPGETGRIFTALEAVTSLEMKAVLMGMSVSALNPYYKEDAARFIARKIIEFTKNQEI